MLRRAFCWLKVSEQRERVEVMADIQPTLEDLRDKATPAWLWDAGRARVVWANKAGVAAFDAANLFDLIDRSFDPQEQGVARVAALARELERGKGLRALLHFPSVGSVVPLDCRCWLHALADGRAGVLVVQEPEKPKLSVAPGGIAASLVDGLPMAVLVLDAEGVFLHGNAAAQSLVASDGHTNLGEFLGSVERAQKLLARLTAASIVTTTEHVGARDFKCVFTRGANASVTLLVEDVTERRALEQDMLSRQIEALDAKVAAAVEPAPVPTIPQPSAFENLGKSIEEAVKAHRQEVPAKKEEVAVPDLEVEVPRASVRVPFVPDAIRNSLERTGRAIVVTRENEGLFATSHAAKLSGL